MKTISTEELKQRRDSIKDLTLINTLDEEHFDNHKIEGSINIPQKFSDFVERVSASVINNKESEIVVYCANEGCDSSTEAAKKLSGAGFENVFDYEGGAKAWDEARQESAS